MAIEKQRRIALIDPVGIKAGMDHYDLLLLSGIQNETFHVKLYTNFSRQVPEVEVKQVFFNTGVAKWRAVLSNFTGFLQALLECRSEGTKWIVLHVFRAGIFDLVTFSLARLLGLRICAIVHDIESLDTFTLPFIRRTVTGTLPAVRVVHNAFSRDELLKTIGQEYAPGSAIIPHVHFRHLFRHYREPGGTSDNTPFNATLAAGIHPALPETLQSKTPVLLFFGQIKRAKGLDVLLEAIAQCRSDFRVVIAGKVRDDNWSRYDGIITSLNLQGKVLPAIRHISDEERDFLFSISKGIVLPYTRIYQSGVLLMAMSFPRPVIASDLPPNAELLRHGKNGLLFESENPKNLALRIEELLSGKYDTEELMRQALSDIDGLYSPSVIGAQYRALLQ
ncbi:MAG: glycosyltransferase [Bacteroidia bacterium]|nr:glycosyltransferase [Bacteroidia bacterium]